MFFMDYEAFETVVLAVRGDSAINEGVTEVTVGAEGPVFGFFNGWFS